MRSNNQYCKTCTINDCFIARHCSKEWKIYIDDHKSCVNYRKKQNIFYQGDEVFGIYFICSGKVKVFRVGPEGKTQIIRLASSGDILGHRGHGGNAIYPIGAATLEDSNISFIENSHYYKVLKQNPDMIYHLMLFYAEELMRSEARIQHLTYAKSKERVAEALLMINNVYGKVVGDKVLLDVILTRREIAEIAGLSHEQVVRTLSDMKKIHLIETRDKTIFILDIAKLKSIVYPSDIINKSS